MNLHTQTANSEIDIKAKVTNVREMNAITKLFTNMMAMADPAGTLDDKAIILMYSNDLPDENSSVIEIKGDGRGYYGNRQDYDLNSKTRDRENEAMNKGKTSVLKEVEQRMEKLEIGKEKKK